MNPIVTPRDAEKNAAARMRELGFTDARVTEDGPDEGIDVSSRNAVAQVKNWNKIVGRPELQRLYGARANNQHQKMLFFARTGFAKTALAYADTHKIALFTFDHAGVITPVNGAARALKVLPKQKPRYTPPKSYEPPKQEPRPRPYLPSATSTHETVPPSATSTHETVPPSATSTPPVSSAKPTGRAPLLTRGWTIFLSFLAVFILVVIAALLATVGLSETGSILWKAVSVILLLGIMWVIGSI